MQTIIQTIDEIEKKINQSLKNMKKCQISSIFCEIRCSVGINSLSTLHQNLKQITSVI